MQVLGAIHAIHKQLHQRLDERAAEVGAREAGYRKGLDQCATDRREIDRERQSLVEAARIYEREFQSGMTVPLFDDLPVAPSTFPEPKVPDEGKPLKARIGPQRYRMLHLLREAGNYLAAEAIASVTGLAVHRVKGQMADDHAIGVVATFVAGSAGSPTYSLTETGLDLLERFESYKRARGEPLPSVSGPLGDDEQDEVQSEELAEATSE